MENEREETFDDIETGDISPAGSPVNSDGEDDPSSLREAILAGKGRTKLSPIGTRGVVNKDSSHDPRVFTIANVPDQHNARSVHKVILATSKISGCKVRKGFNKTWHIHCNSVEDVQKAVSCKYSIGDVASAHGAILHFYRVTYVADEIKPDHGDRIAKAFLDEHRIKVLSLNINAEKKCVSVYLGNDSDFGYLNTSPNGDTIKVKGTSAFHGTYHLHSVRSCSSSNDPNIGKYQVTNIPPGFEEDMLLVALKKVLSPIIPNKNILGLSIYRFPNTNRNSNFGFLHVLGADAAEVLERVEVPIEGATSLVCFERAKEGERKRKREE